MNEKGFDPISMMAALGENVKYLVAGVLAIILIIVGIFFFLFAIDLVIYLVMMIFAGALVYAGIFVLEEDRQRWAAIGIAVIIMLALLFLPRLGWLAFA